MGTCDGAQVYKLVGRFLIPQISDKYNKKDIALNRDDGSSFSKAKVVHKRENKEKFSKNFPENGLYIVIKRSVKITDYLNVTLNLLIKTYKPCSKPSNEISYSHKKYNHPPTHCLKSSKYLFQLSHGYHVFPQVKIFNESAPI